MAPLPQRGTAARRGNFVSNAFDPRSFYEEEEEEEEGSDIPGHDQYAVQNSFQAPPPPPVEPSREHLGPSEETRGPFPPEQRKEAPDSSAAPHTESSCNNQGGGGGGGGTLSTDDLLDLFGGGSTQPEKAPKEPPMHLSNVENVTAEPGKENAPPTEPEDDFALPPPSDSSDDEEEQD